MIEQFGAIPEFIDEDVYCGVEWWIGHQLTKDCELLLDSCLPRYKHWRQGTLAWGKEDGDRVDVHLDYGQIKEVFIRIDVREFDESFLTCIINLAICCDCYMLLMDEMKVIEARKSVLIYEMRGSRAFQFVENPKKFLNEITGKKPLKTRR